MEDGEVSVDLKQKVSPSIKPFEVLKTATVFADKHVAPPIMREQEFFFKKEKWYRDISIYKLSFVLVINFVYFGVELAMGLYLKSLSLTTDAFSMLSDVISQVIGIFVAFIVKNAFTENFTYGFARAEVVGAFINSVFQISIGFSLVIQSVEKFFDLEEVGNPIVLLIVAGVGLLVNVVGMVVLGNYSFCINNFNKRHNTTKETNTKINENLNKKENNTKEVQITIPNTKVLAQAKIDVDESESEEEDDKVQFDANFRDISANLNSLSKSPNISASPRNAPQTPNFIRKGKPSRFAPPNQNESEDVDKQTNKLSPEPIPNTENPISKSRTQIPPLQITQDIHPPHKKKKRNMNIAGVFIHVFGDFMGSVSTMGVALIVYFFDDPKKQYADPAFSLLVSLMMIVTGVPLLYSCVCIVMQMVPKKIKISDLRKEVLDIEEVIAVHDFHLWQLNNKIYCSTIKVLMSDNADGNACRDKVKRIMRKSGIALTNVECTFSVKRLDSARLKYSE
ncbi:cation efflux protein/ zinc transporter, putative [Entamoeba invadens IP1]|uniref:Cation efflux protein/ zinc transporter, putative n=1 Tax=Entamoeba invadens IP1 TaxID=370355 RepID=A0A0A1U026_ENTIV|nr:cation efflux protein/ zinc transporter, putative [Entamoeba invadens IP1]ELP87229.1 cation efflux protein/ zinc transporter, putative [Entamoeba invadens IP1]|eukprot:XP_004254000.1 cation efflux protein/ zinc transporter, putative [Entamoeba invadens IP1]